MTNNSSAPTTSAFDLSIVIVNYRCWGKLADCLKSLTDAPSSLNLEVVVVDNQSGDGKLDAFAEEHPKVNFVSNSGNWGFASGCNAGAVASSAADILFLNPDTLATPDSVNQLLEIKRSNQDIGLLSCHQIDGNGNSQRAFGFFQKFWTTFGLTRAIVQRLFPKAYPSARIQQAELIDCDWISGSVVLVSRAQLDSLGGWDEEFWMYSEDVDLCKRAWDSGLRVCYEPSVTITHLHGGSSRSSKATKAITKSEVIVSKHVFINKHSTNSVSAFGNHGLVMLQRIFPLLLLALITSPSWLLGKPTSAALKFGHLRRYYWRWATTGVVSSPRCKTD
jgi:GT2 family glycosyltransferase